jgi:hypothetical protein
MLLYQKINRLWKASPDNSVQDVEGYLIDSWIDDYVKGAKPGSTDLVVVDLEGFSYLFDVHQERLIAAWGISKGKVDETRDATRMLGHPQSAGKAYHRGHAIAHQLGGKLDINLISQKGSINMGQFRVLENKAAKTPGALYFTYWEYNRILTQKPSAVQQGLLCPGEDAELRWFPN